MKNDTYDIVIKCDTEEQRDSVLEKVDELKNKSCGSVWHKHDQQIAEDRKDSDWITNIFFKESYVGCRDSQEREVC